MAVVATELVAGREGLLALVPHSESAADFRERQERALVISPVTVGARCVLAVIGIVMMAVNPGLAQIVHPVRSTGLRYLHVGVANGALGQLGNVALLLRGIHIVVGVERRELGVLRTVASCAVGAAVAGAVTEQRLARQWNVVVGGKRGVSGSSPDAIAGKRIGVALAGLVAHLAG